MDRLDLRPFERDHLPLVEPWFLDVQTQRWLGGTDWPRVMLDLAERPLGEFRGAAETGRYRWLAWQGARAVGYIDCGTQDRWTTSEGGPDGRGVIATIEAPAASVAFVVDPALRRRDYATAMIEQVIRLPELNDVVLFAAGVEPDNVASIRALTKAGFLPLDPKPDFEGIIYYALAR